MFGEISVTVGEIPPEETALGRGRDYFTKGQVQ
jgi:hypothetical protein